jgi:outer membrane receptor protein involved in Fe transport
VPARARIIQVNGAVRTSYSFTLTRVAGPDEPARILAAGLAGADAAAAQPADAETDDHDHGEMAWRLRHLKRSVLKETGHAVAIAGEDDSFLVDSLSTLGRAMGQSARLASGLFADLPVSGQFNLLTSTSFDRPHELFSVSGGPPRGVAFLALTAPTPSGDWSMRGAMTQGDLASWILAGSYVGRAGPAHKYEAGLSYSMQRYQGGNAVALAAVTDGSRNAGTVYAYDHWTIVPGATLTYGAHYARYDYLETGGLFSPRVAFAVSPAPGFRVRATVSRREQAPGAEEFMPPSGLGVWLPPERTFSPVSARQGFRPEQMDSIELASEHDLPAGFMLGLRTFRQRVDDQSVTLFGMSLPHSAAADVGHYYVGTAGDFVSHGWGVGLSRPLAGRLRGSIDYTQADAEWVRMSPDLALLSVVARSTLRRRDERLHDVTTSMDTEIPATATRLFVIYKVNTGFVAPDAASRPRAATRFDLQVHQALPFLNFTRAQWEALVAIRNLFHDELLDASVYDELLVMRPPKRVVGGLTVRF